MSGKAKFLRDAALTELRDSVAENLDAYRSGNFKHLEVDDSAHFDGSFDIDWEKLEKLKVPVANNLFEVENCVTLYPALDGLTAYDARDERFWTFLTHTVLLDYTRARWPIPDDDEKAVEHILLHFFAKDKRQIERDNAASRLWWMAHLCKRVPDLSLEDALKAFLYKADVRANIIERPTISQATPIFAAIIGKLWASLNGNKKLFERKPFRSLMIEINSVGGFKLLDGMSKDDVEDLVSDVIENKLNLSSV